MSSSSSSLMSLLDSATATLWHTQCSIAQNYPVFIQPMVLFLCSVNVFVGFFMLVDLGLLDKYPWLKPVSLAPPTISNKKRGSALTLVLFTVGWNIFAFVLYRLVDYFMGTNTSLFYRDEASLWHSWGYTNAYTLSMLPFQQQPTLGGTILSTTVFAAETCDITTAPTFLTVCGQMVSLMLMWDLCFYWVHLILHIPFLRVRIHFSHHEIQYCTAPIIFFVDAIDGIVNYAAIVLPPMLLTCHPLTLSVFYFTVAYMGSCSHSGYDVAWSTSRYHYVHHMRHNVNFGVIGVQDLLFGTYMTMDEAVCSTRDYWPADGTLSEWAKHRGNLVPVWDQRQADKTVVVGSEVANETAVTATANNLAFSVDLWWRITTGPSGA